MVDMLGICGASSVSEYYPTHLDDLALTPGAKPLAISTVVSWGAWKQRSKQLDVSEFSRAIVSDKGVERLCRAICARVRQS